jgi:hypothetical protein
MGGPQSGSHAPAKHKVAPYIAHLVFVVVAVAVSLVGCIYLWTQDQSWGRPHLPTGGCCPKKKPSSYAAVSGASDLHTSGRTTLIQQAPGKRMGARCCVHADVEPVTCPPDWAGTCCFSATGWLVECRLAGPQAEPNTDAVDCTMRPACPSLSQAVADRTPADAPVACVVRLVGPKVSSDGVGGFPAGLVRVGGT